MERCGENACADFRLSINIVFFFKFFLMFLLHTSDEDVQEKDQDDDIKTVGLLEAVFFKEKEQPLWMSM